MAAQECIDTGSNKRASVSSLRILGKIPRVALKRNQYFQVRVSTLQFLKLVKIAAERRSRAVCLAVDAIPASESGAQIGIGIGERAAAVANRSLRIVDLVEPFSGFVSYEHFHVEGLRQVETPLRKVSDQQGKWRLRIRILSTAGSEARQQNSSDEEKLKAGRNGH